MKLLTRFLCAGVFVSIVAGCASNSSYVPRLPTHAKAMYADYLNMPGNKVFVVAVDPSGEFAVGYDCGNISKEAAYSAALEQCKANAAEYGVLTEPMVYDINGTVVYSAAVKQAQAKD